MSAVPCRREPWPSAAALGSPRPNSTHSPLLHRCHQPPLVTQVEQFVITSPEGDASWEAMEEMLGNAEDFYQARGGG